MLIKKERWILLVLSLLLTTGLTTLVIRATDNLSLFTASLTDPSDSGRCPAGMVFISSENGGFCIDKYENSPGKGCTYPDPENQNQTRVNLEAPDCLAVSKEGAVPWRNISQDQAQIACSKAGKRLPTNEEWFQAAMGTPDKESGWSEEDCQVDNNWESQPGPTGSGDKCVSAAGAYDMIGNLWEWVKGTAFNGIFEEKELPDSGYVVSTDGYGVPGMTEFTSPDPNYNEDFFWIKKNQLRAFMRGGYWDNGSDAGIYSAYLVVPPSFSGVGVGFRCVK